MKLRGWGMRGHARRNFPVNIIRNNNIYMVCGEDLRYKDFKNW